MSWKMELCTSGAEVETYKKTFENFEDGVDWLRIHHPSLLAPESWKSIDGEKMRQFGMDYYWAQFVRVHGCCSGCDGTGYSGEPEANGACWDCQGSGHPHQGDCP